MSDGYQVVEPTRLASILGNPKCFDLAVLLLQWIAAEANRRHTAGSAMVEVIKVDYAGTYPALGVKGTSLEGIEVALDKLAGELLEARTADLVGFAAKSGFHWRDHAAAILGSNPESPPPSACG